MLSSLVRRGADGLALCVRPASRFARSVAFVFSPLPWASLYIASVWYTLLRRRQGAVVVPLADPLILWFFHIVLCTAPSDYLVRCDPWGLLFHHYRYEHPTTDVNSLRVCSCRRPGKEYNHRPLAQARLLFIQHLCATPRSTGTLGTGGPRHPRRGLKFAAAVRQLGRCPPCSPTTNAVLVAG